MRITFADKATREEALSLELLINKYGRPKARKIRQRLDEIHASTNLYIFSKLPATYCMHIEQTNRIAVSTLDSASIILSFLEETLGSSENLIDSWKDITDVIVLSLDGVQNVKQHK